MFKIIIFLVIVIVGSYFIYDYVHLSFFNNHKLTHIKADNLKYKSIPKNQEGFNFVGDSLGIYDVTREKLLPKEVMQNEEAIEIDDINKKETSVNTNNINNCSITDSNFINLNQNKCWCHGPMLYPPYKCLTNLNDCINILSI